MSTQETQTKSPFELYKRNEHGLIEGTEYVFNEDGSVNWRAMIKPEFLYPNRDWFELRKQPVPTSIEGLDDKQLLIMLGGIKELAKLRGFCYVGYQVENRQEDYVFAKCKIQWIPNYETDKNIVAFEDVANATPKNTDDFCLKFLETIACNRAFVRAVRNFLNIHIVGADEIDKSKNRVSDISDLLISNALPLTPQGTLEKVVNENLKIQSFEDFTAFLRKLWKSYSDAGDSVSLKSLQEAITEIKDWKAFKDIPSKSCRVLLKLTNEYKKNNKS